MFKSIFDYIASQHLQLTKFIIVGVTTSGLYFICFHFFYHIIQVDYRVSSSIAYIITILCHFVLHRNFTFGATEQNMAINGWKYISMLALNYLIMLTVVWMTVSLLKMSPYIGVFFSIGITAVVSFLVMKYFVFALR